MAKLIYAAISSLDGYVADSDGNFEWSMPDEEVHRFVNGLERDIGIYLYGRRMYDVMRYWRQRRPVMASPQRSKSSPGRGRQQTRSFTPGLWIKWPPPGPGWSMPSTCRRFST
jgi:dihydrofolate reductase